MKLSEAVTLAAILHDGQRDKAGACYLAHPVRVMLGLPADVAPETQIAALLHDTLEDTAATVDLFRAWHVPERSIELVVKLTRKLDESYPAYVDRISQDPDAVAIKRADLLDNLDEYRLAKLPVPEAARLRRKYTAALAALVGV